MDRAKRAFDAIENNTHGILSLVLTGTDYIVHDDDADYSVMDISNMSVEESKISLARKGTPSVDKEDALQKSSG